MKKKAKLDKNFNAVQTFTSLSKQLQDSQDKIIGYYTNIVSNYHPAESIFSKAGSVKDEHEIDLESFKTGIENLATFLNINTIQAIIFVALYSQQLMRDNDVDIDDITRFIGISNVEFLPLKKEISGLVEGGLIKEDVGHRSTDYRITPAVERSLMSNTPFVADKRIENDRYKFCEIISRLISDRNNDRFDTCDLWYHALKVERQNEKLTFLQTVKKALPNIEDRVLFYEICDDFIRQRSHESGVDCTLSDIYDNARERFAVAKALKDGNHTLTEQDLIRMQDAQFLSESTMSLTEKGKELFLENDYELFTKGAKDDKRLITPDKLPERELFFNDELSADIDFLKRSLMDEQFIALQERLSERSLAKGVAVLFYGLPGTGKTATAETLAKATGRSVYHVDIAASKTCWFGESEKLIKRIFTDYKDMCKHSDKKPILLFNEADALFSKRKDSNASNVAQTENAIQNILLEEMENLDGILICTTNLSDNLDSAFDRRFLFKIKFGQPNTQAKQAIWKSKLPWLSDDDCQRLASSHDLSGGAIDNIVRKALMEEVLNGQRPSFEMLQSWCKGERLSNNSSAIGFSC